MKTKLLKHHYLEWSCSVKLGPAGGILVRKHETYVAAIVDDDVARLMTFLYDFLNS